MPALSKWFDLVLLILILTIGVLLLPFVFIELNTPIMSKIEDKTALRVENALYVGHVNKTGADLFMGLVVVDEFLPFPKSIRINETPVIDLNKTWIANKYGNINKIYSEEGEYKLSKMLDWNITSVEFIENGGDSYWQFRLEES